jgi:hypothetical protein
MTAAFLQHLAAGQLAQWLQVVELLIQSLGATTQTRFPQFLEPLVSMMGVENLLARTGDPTTSIHSFDSVHHPR